MKKLLTTVNKSIMLMMYVFLSLALIVSCGDDESSDPMVPTPNPTTTGGTDTGGGTADPSNVTAFFEAQVDAENSLTYDFTNSSVVNGIADTSFDSAWDFGGDGTSTEANPTYTFSAEGTYDVVLTVTAADGVTATQTKTVEVTAPKNRYAVITDSTGDDTGELRLSVDSIAVGRIAFMYRVAAGPVDMDIQDGFINVSGSSTTGDFALVEVRLKDDAPHEFREGASDDAIAAASFPEGVANEWVPVEVSWAADLATAPTYSVSIGGQTVLENGISTTNGGDGDVEGHLAAVIDGAANFQWKYAGNSAISDGMFHVDDIVVYSSDSGTETEVFSDNFQGRVAGDNLNPGEDVATPYHVNSADASVGEDE